MSSSNQTTGLSASNFTLIFDAGLDEYKRLTTHDLRTHSFAAELGACDSPDTVLEVFQRQTQAFSKPRKDEKLMKWLKPTVHVLFSISATLGVGIGLSFHPASVIFTGISVLLGAVKGAIASYDVLVNVFEHIQLFLQRLNCYNDIPLTHNIVELLGKTMAQVLSVLALSTTAMKDGLIKKSLKRLVGTAEIEDALQRLNDLTKQEGLMTTARNLEVTHHVDDNVTVIKRITHDINSDLKVTKNLAYEHSDKLEVIKGLTLNFGNTLEVVLAKQARLGRSQLLPELRKWLNPPDSSINHDTARYIRLSGTATWFLQGSKFEDWKRNGSLLWIRGIAGSGKSILCSAIIEDIKHLREAGSALITYYYFDFQNVDKRNLRGLVSSLLMQLGEDSFGCWDVLHEFYTTCRNGLDQPRDAALARCLRDMLELPGQRPIYVIMDAVDECPHESGMPSPRKQVLDFVKDLVGWRHTKLRICATSRPEKDIQAALDPLMSSIHLVSLHEEGKQLEDVNSYIKSFVYSSELVQGWGREDKESVIATLSGNANGRFRWAHCQLDTLRQCFPSGIHEALEELPSTLEDTYERILQGIPVERWEYAHRLFQCLIAALRPLHVTELAEILAMVGFDGVPKLVDDWRPEDPEEALLSTCSTLISVINDGGSKIVQFSHSTVKEFLTLPRPRTSMTMTRDIPIPLAEAHATLARACLGVLLRLGDHVDKECLEKFPLAFYAAQHWVDHAKVEDVALQIQDAMACLLDPRKAHFTAWTWIHDPESQSRRNMDDLTERPFPPIATPLYYAVSCGFTELARDFIVDRGDDVNAGCGRYGTPLHAASYKGDLATASLLLQYGADVNSNIGGQVPLRRAYNGGHVGVMCLLLEYGADGDMRDGNRLGTVLHHASYDGQLEMVRLLLQAGADVNGKGFADQTPLHLAVIKGQTKVAQLLIQHGADANAKSEISFTPFQAATMYARHDIVRLMLEGGAEGEEGL